MGIHAKQKQINIVTHPQGLSFYYLGRRYLMPHSKGLYYLMRLLENPFRHIKALDLYYRENLPADSDLFIKLCRDSEGFETSLSNCFSLIPMTDAKTVSSVKQRLQSIENTLSETKEYGFPADMEELLEERSKLLKYLEEVLSISKRIRYFGDTEKQVVVGVYRSLCRTLERLEGMCPPMAKALRSDLSLWRSLAYVPSKSIVTWEAAYTKGRSK